MRNHSEVRKLRGRSAIDAAHTGVVGEDEARLDAEISMLYEVQRDEAAEIHTNYHVDRIFSSLVQRARDSGMKKEAIAKRVQNLDFVGVASQVAAGKLAEAAAVDALFRNLARTEAPGTVDDRYINFYG